MTKRRHYAGDGCDPPHVLTVLAPEDPDVVRKRDSAYLDRQDTYDTHAREETEHG